jgi:hypothetical protein
MFGVSAKSKSAFVQRNDLSISDKTIYESDRGT